jgi:hypothetical protein
MRMELTVHVELDEDNKVEADCMERLRGCADRLAQLVEKVEEE